jgi:hypothetical protein
MICSQRKYLFPIFAIAIAIGAAGCTNNGNGSTATTPTPTVVTEMYTGSITQGGADIHNFTVTNSGLNLLAGFTSISPSTITGLGVGIGAYDPTSSTCGLNQLQATAGVGSTAITTTAPSGPFCVRVTDGGNIPAGGAATYTLEVQHY